MQMVEVVRDGFIERRELGVDQQVMMTRVLAIRTRRCNAHVAQPEIELQLCRNGRSILEIDKVDLGSRAGRSRTAGALRVRCGSSSCRKSASKQHGRQKSHDLAEWRLMERIHCLASLSRFDTPNVGCPIGR